MLLHFGLIRRGFSGTGGAEAYLKRLAEALQQAGHRVTVYGSPEWPEADRPAGCGFQAVPGRTPRDFAAALRALEPSGAGGCDVVYSLERVENCHYYRAGDGVHAAWLERRKVLDPWWKIAWRGLDPKHRQLLRLERTMLTAPELRGVIANSHLVAEELRRIHGLDLARIHVVHNGLPDREFGYDAGVRAAERQRLGLRADETAVVFAGTGWERKGLRWAIAATERAARSTSVPLRLLVAGRGKAERYRHPIATFLGPVKPIRPLLMAGDIFILPTVYDPFSNATLEAFAAGLPVVTTRANGFSEIMLHPEDGAAVEHGSDVPALAAALEQLLPLAASETSRTARVQRASQHTMERNVRETLAVLTAGL